MKFDPESLEEVKSIFLTYGVEDVRKKLNLPADGRDWSIEMAKNDLRSNNPSVIKYQYRPFDDRFTLYSGKTKGFIAYPRYGVLRHLNTRHENVGLLLPRQAITGQFGFFVCNAICDINYTGSAGQFGAGLCFPLYSFVEEDDGQLSTDSRFVRIANLNPQIATEIAARLKSVYNPDKETNIDFLNIGNSLMGDQVGPQDIFDYAYASLFCPLYLSKYKEFLKIEFARIPFQDNADKFWKLVNLGTQLRNLHLLKSPELDKFITQYPIDGNNVVNKVVIRDRNVFINEFQYFANVPENIWRFNIGTHQPAQKWLKDRKGRELTYNDINHYQKIIVALTRTDEIMKEIDEIIKC